MKKSASTIIKTLSVSIFALAVAGVQSSYAFMMSVTNKTGHTAYVDVWGIGKIGGSLFDGKKGIDNDPQTSKAGGTTMINYANALLGPQQINANETVNYNFQQLDAGVCFNLNDFKVGLENAGVQSVPIRTMPDNTWNQVVPAIQGFGSSFTDIGQALADTNVPELQAAGAAGKGLTEMLSGITKLVAVSTCKNMSVILVYDTKENQVIGLTRDVAM